jgi:peptidoglycan/LPS O-acetylase OafA/YrhL
LYSTLPLTAWFYKTWHTAFTGKLILWQLAFAWDSGDGANRINPAFWSLRPEMLMSVLFPAICWILKRLPSAGGWALATGTVLLGEGKVPIVSAHIPYGWQYLILCASAFLFGAMLAKDMDGARQFYRRINVPARYALAACVIFGFYRGVGQSGLGILAACGVIVFADCSRMREWLTTPWPLYLGKISYSLYLLHIVFLFTSVILLYGKVPLWTIFLTYIVTSLAASHFYNRHVEEGSMALGKRLSGRKTLILDEQLPKMAVSPLSPTE